MGKTWWSSKCLRCIALLVHATYGSWIWFKGSLTLSSCTLFLNYREKTGNFVVLGCCAAKICTNNILHMNKNLMHSRRSLLPAFQNKRKWLKIWTNQKVTEKRISKLSVSKDWSTSRDPAEKLKMGLFHDILVFCYIQIQNDLNWKDFQWEISFH